VGIWAGTSIPPVPILVSLHFKQASKRTLTESTTIEVNKHRQPFTLPSPTTSLPTTTTAPTFATSRRPNTQLQAILTNIARPIETLQIILQNLVSVNPTRVRVEVLDATRADLRSLDIRFWLGQRLRRCPSQVAQRRLSERDAQELADVRLRGVDFAVDAARGGLHGQLIVVGGSGTVGGRMGCC